MPDTPYYDEEQAAIIIDVNGTEWHATLQWSVVDDTHFPSAITFAIPDRTALPDASGAITPTNIRRLNLGAVLAAGRTPDAIRQAAQREHDDVITEFDAIGSMLEAGDGTHSASETFSRLSDIIEASDRVVTTPVGPQQGTRITQEQLDLTARIYKQAAAVGQPVTQAVADALHVSTSTAGKRIMKARRAGLIPPTQDIK